MRVISIAYLLNLLNTIQHPPSQSSFAEVASVLHKYLTLNPINVRVFEIDRTSLDPDLARQWMVDRRFLFTAVDSQ